jgi:adenosylhomocysteine nucleosidase
MTRNDSNSLPNHLIVMAIAQESRGRLEAARAPLLYTGVGKVNAAMSLARHLAEIRSQSRTLPLVINLGTAGSRTIGAGTLVACNRFSQRDMDVTAMGFARGETPFDATPAVIETPVVFSALPHVTCSTADSFATDQHAVDGDVVDMEAFALARVCLAEGASFACAKFVTDGADGSAANDWTQALERAARAFAHLYTSSLRSPTE